MYPSESIKVCKMRNDVCTGRVGSIKSYGKEKGLVLMNHG